MAAVATDAHVELERKLARRLHDDSSHRVVSDALTRVAFAAVHPGPRRPDEVEASGLLEDPVASATRVAVETLLDELQDLVDALPESMVEMLASEQAVDDVDDA